MVASAIDSGRGICLLSTGTKYLNSCCQNAEGEFSPSLYASYIMELLSLNGYSMMYSTNSVITELFQAQAYGRRAWSQ